MLDRSNAFYNDLVRKEVSSCGAQKSFLKICSILPEIVKIYRVEDSQTALLENLKINVNNLGTSKRNWNRIFV